MTTPFTLKGIDHVVLLVRDMDEALRFYEQVLGCHVERTLDRIGMRQLRAGASLIDLIDIGSDAGSWARPEMPGGRNMDHLALAIDGWDEAAMRNHLAAHGVDIVEEGTRYGAGGEGLSFYIRDPSGNMVELKGPPAQN